MLLVGALGKNWRKPNCPFTLHQCIQAAHKRALAAAGLGSFSRAAESTSLQGSQDVPLGTKQIDLCSRTGSIRWISAELQPSALNFYSEVVKAAL